MSSGCSGEAGEAGDPAPVIITPFNDGGPWTDESGLIWFDAGGTPFPGVTLVDEASQLWKHIDGSLGYVVEDVGQKEGVSTPDASSGLDPPTSVDERDRAGTPQTVPDGSTATATTVVDTQAQAAEEQRVGAATAALQYVSAGAGYSCGVRTDGTIECWGYNDYGQADAPEGAFSAVSAGGSHTCGVRANGTIECWGNNHLGQSNAPEGQFVAVSVSVGSGTTGNHSCGLRADGHSVCWGVIHRRGQLGGLPSGDQFVSVSAGGSHTCWIRPNDTVTCWGNNFYGQADEPEGQFVSVSAGVWHSCGVHADGTIECWGRYSWLPDVLNGEFVSVSAGGEHSCGVHADGTIECWGNNDYGQADRPEGEFVSVSAGAGHSCGLRADGAIECWGSNGIGQSDPPAGTFGL